MQEHLALLISDGLVDGSGLDGWRLFFLLASMLLLLLLFDEWKKGESRWRVGRRRFFFSSSLTHMLSF